MSILHATCEESEEAAKLVVNIEVDVPDHNHLELDKLPSCVYVEDCDIILWKSSQHVYVNVIYRSYL